MLRTALFWWDCAREAAHGTIEKANAWFWLIGLPIVAFAGRYWEVGELTIPDTAPGFLTFMVVTIVVTWLVLFVIRLFGAPSQLFWRERDFRLAAEARFAELRDPKPNWPIRELFNHIEPDVENASLDQESSLDGGWRTIDTDTRSDLWDKVGADIRDKLSTGDLRIWGRPIGNGIGAMLGERAALQLIDPNYWRAAHFTFGFFADQAREPHTYVELNSGLPQFTDLLINRAQALLLWPRAGGCGACVVRKTGDMVD